MPGHTLAFSPGFPWINVARRLLAPPPAPPPAAPRALSGRLLAHAWHALLGLGAAMGLLLAVALTLAGLLGGCTDADDPPPMAQSTSPYEDDGQAARQWMELSQSLVEQQALSPPVAARAYAMMGLAMYEGLVYGMDEHRSMVGQLRDLIALPTPTPANAYDWSLVMAESAATMARYLFDDPAAHRDIDDLLEAQRAQSAAGREGAIHPVVRERSRLYGQRLGTILVSWSKTDGFEDRHRHTFEPYDTPWAWMPAPGTEPVEPFWGTIRLMALESSSSCVASVHAPYAETPGSSFYDEAMAVYRASRELTEEQRQIAQFWADLPGSSPTPAGHWMAIASVIARENGANLAETAAIYALLGAATHDAFVSCWAEKYRSMLLRPEAYIRRFIDPQWQPLLQTPNFPEYTSGHSSASAAASRILAAFYPDLEGFTDPTHEGRGLAPRSFPSFEAAAREAAQSRLYGGIHYPMGISNGMPQGHCVAENLLEHVRLLRGPNDAPKPFLQ